MKQLVPIPFRCEVIKTGKEFTPVIVDYDNKQVLWQRSQTSDDCEWYHFNEVRFDNLSDMFRLLLSAIHQSERKNGASDLKRYLITDLEIIEKKLKELEKLLFRFE